jgi:hypothetical protein
MRRLAPAPRDVGQRPGDGARHAAQESSGGQRDRDLGPVSLTEQDRRRRTVVPSRAGGRERVEVAFLEAARIGHPSGVGPGEIGATKSAPGAGSRSRENR